MAAKKAATKAAKKSKKAKKAATRAATDMAAVSSQASAIAAAKPDGEIVQAAYEDSLKESVNTYILNCVHDAKVAEERFLTGLTIMRTARDRAIQLVG